MAQFITTFAILSTPTEDSWSGNIDSIGHVLNTTLLSSNTLSQLKEKVETNAFSLDRILGEGMCKCNFISSKFFQGSDGRYYVDICWETKSSLPFGKLRVWIMMDIHHTMGDYWGLQDYHFGDNDSHLFNMSFVELSYGNKTYQNKHKIKECNPH